ncbi:MAG: CHC2 zinc finger domain-containing protein [Vulcanimicrobiota bacterium]
MNDFSRQDIEALKASVDLCELMRSHGVELKAVGRNFTAVCPWHDDREASLVVNPEKQLYNCFGCDAKGDALSFLQAQENLSFPQAVLRLKENAGDTGKPSSVPPRPGDHDRFPGGHTRNDLLEKVCKHYQNGLEGSEEARQYLKDRKLWNSELYEGFQFGYCDGTLLKALPKGDVRDALCEIGILNSKGREHFLGCVVVPLFHPTDGLVGFYGRRIDPAAKVRHLFLPGPKRAVFGFQAMEAARSVYVTEGVFDALSLWLVGLRPVTCVFGVGGGLPEELEKHLRASSITELRLCFDDDRSGRRGQQKVLRQAGDRFKMSRVVMPAEIDANKLLVREGPDMLRSFARCLKPLSSPEDLEPKALDESAKHLPLTETADTDFRLTFTEPAVTYLVTPQPPFNSSRLKVTIRAERTPPPGTAKPNSLSARYLDRCDLVSSRSRTEVLRGLSQQLSLDAETAKLHLAYILDTSEHFGAAHGKLTDSLSSEKPPELSDEEKADALEFLQAPDLTCRVQHDMEALGYVGEERGKLLAYLVGLSRKLENPLSAIIRSQSGAGKSGLASLVASLVPPEDVIHYSRVSAHALAYAGKDAYKRKLLLMEERVGGEAADYYIRILQSSHMIRQAVVIKDPITGQMKTQEFEVEGPIAYIETTTASLINQENASRCFEIYLDETEEQTRRIHECQRLSREAVRLQRVRKDAICARHHNAQRMLEQLPVVIPYVRHLTFPTRWLRTRRDNERFLCLIEVSALLHQHQRPCGQLDGPDGEPVRYVEASVEDYRLAYELAKDVLRDTLHELSISARELLRRASSVEDTPFTRRHLRDLTGWSQKRIHQAVHELVDMEYFAAITGANGKAYQYTVIGGTGEGPSPVNNLLHPDELAAKLHNSDP